MAKSPKSAVKAGVEVGAEAGDETAAAAAGGTLAAGARPLEKFAKEFEAEEKSPKSAGADGALAAEADGNPRL